MLFDTALILPVHAQVFLSAPKKVAQNAAGHCSRTFTMSKLTFYSGKTGTDGLRLVAYSRDHVPQYHEWMSSEQLRLQTASEPLTLEQEYEMQQAWQIGPDSTLIALVIYLWVLSRTHIYIGMRRCCWGQNFPEYAPSPTVSRTAKSRHGGRRELVLARGRGCRVGGDDCRTVGEKSWPSTIGRAVVDVVRRCNEVASHKICRENTPHQRGIIAPLQQVFGFHSRNSRAELLW